MIFPVLVGIVQKIPSQGGGQCQDQDLVAVEPIEKVRILRNAVQPKIFYYRSKDQVLRTCNFHMMKEVKKTLPWW